MSAPPGLPNATRRRVRAIHDRLAKRFGPLAPPRVGRPARRAGAHGAVPAHQRPERRARVRRPAGGVPDVGGRGRRRRRPPSPTRSARAGSPTRRRRGIQAILREVRDREGAYALDRLRDHDGRGRARLPDVAARHRPEDGGGRPQLRARSRRDPRRHARASDHAPPRHRPRDGLGRTRRPAAARPRPRRSADAACTWGSSGWAARSARRPVPRCHACPLRDLCPTAPRYLAPARKRSTSP